jgi:hypothetical protein
MRALLFAIVLTSCAAALADEGEIFVGGNAGVDVAWLRHPLAPVVSLLPDAHATTAVVPRMSITAAYSCTNEFLVTLGVNAAGTANLVTPRVVVGGVSANLITGTYSALTVPVGVRWRLDSGLPLSFDASLEVAPLLAAFVQTVAIDEVAKDALGKAVRLPLAVSDSFLPGAEARIAGGADLRLANLVVALRPVFGVGWVKGPQWIAGVTLTVEAAL